MAKVTGNYETLYIVNSAVGEEGIAALVAKFKALAEEHGTLGEVNEWGNRRLAYPINDLLEGYYVLMTFSSDPSFPMELDRVFKITDGILRSIIICKDE
jgi:small subunit ribosomal protein S6